MTNTPAKPDQVAEYEGRMIDCLDQLENIWLKESPFLVGDKITIADILGATEVEQPRKILGHKTKAILAFSS